MKTLKAGDVVVYKGNTPISRLIRFFTKSDYTHVALAVGDSDIIEAQRFITTRLRELKPWEEYEVYRLHNLEEATRERIAIMALSYRRRPYDYIQIIGMLLRMILGIRFDFFNRSNALICSELIDLVFYASGVERAHQHFLGDLTPHELFEVYDLRKL